MPLYTGISDLRKAGLKRLADARALLNAPGQHGRGAAYLAGYAIECKLKAIAMERHGCRTLSEPAGAWRVQEKDLLTHRLEELLGRMPQLYNRLKQNEEAWRSFAGQVNRWRSDWRYNPVDLTHDGAKAFLHAVEVIRHWLDRNQ